MIVTENEFVCILRYIKYAPEKRLLYEDRGHEHIAGYTRGQIGQTYDLPPDTAFWLGEIFLSWKSKNKT